MRASIAEQPPKSFSVLTSLRPYCTTAIYLDATNTPKPYAFLEGKTDPAQHAVMLVEQLKSREEAARHAAKNEIKQQRAEMMEDIEFETKICRSLSQQMEALLELLATQEKYKTTLKGYTEPKLTEEQRMKRD